MINKVYLIISILVIILQLILVNSSRSFLLGQHSYKHSKLSRSNSEIKNDYKTYYFKQQVDHFGFKNNDIFDQRYLVNDEHWCEDSAVSGPIFFYTGNEGDILGFYENSGLMFDWAPEFKALIVFAEHRYYGQSMPYGNSSLKDIKYLNYLTAEQALADFVTLIGHLKETWPNAERSKVVAFGGSYGGMLSAWLRMKYPQAVVGALAASAPIFQLSDMIPCDSYNKIVTRDFDLSGDNCASNIRKSWDVINSFAQTDKGLKLLSNVFNLCKLLGDADELKSWLSNTWGNLAMVNYPYPANFLENLPAWPIKEVCKHLLSSAFSKLELLNGIREAVGVYYNYTGDVKCFDTSIQSSAVLNDQTWDFQACTEITMFSCSNGVTDMFEPTIWNRTLYTEQCRQKWNVTPRYEWLIRQFGGRDIKYASNIIFSNGEYDPWSAGGVLESISDSLVAIRIEKAAHHLDLRSSNPLDPMSVVEARLKEKELVSKWIDEANEKYKETYNRMDHYVTINFKYFQNYNRRLIYPLIISILILMYISLGNLYYRSNHFKNQNIIKA